MLTHKYLLTMTIVILYYDDCHIILTKRGTTMPMIDIYAPADVFPEDADYKLGDALTHAVLRAEGVATPAAFHLNNTAVFVHRLPASAISTAANQPARAVRIQIITPPGSLQREGQKQITKEATEIVAELANDPSLKNQTWVILSEASEGGWGIAGTAFGIEEFTSHAQKAAAAQ
jgi:phenylpyruvate tautomerase PptA (4-oxalocrotonate tautomerase family)